MIPKITEMLFSGQHQDKFYRLGVARVGEDEYLRRIVIDKYLRVVDDWAHQRYKPLSNVTPLTNPIGRFVFHLMGRYLQHRDAKVYRKFMEEVERLKKL